MCQTGFSTADYKLAVHQLTELSKLLKNNTEQWSRLADSVHQHQLSHKLEDASEKMTEVIGLLEAAMDDLREHDHNHVHISAD